MARSISLLVVLAVLASGGICHADGGDPAAARALFEEGKAAAKEGDCKSAVPKFSKSFRLDPKPGTLRNLAVCEEELGRLASSLKHYQELVDKFPAATEHVKFAVERSAELEPRVPKLTIKLAEGAPPGTKITLDGEEVAASEVGKELPVDPGEHAIEVTAPGRDPATYKVKLADAEKREQEIEPGPLPTDRATGHQPGEQLASRGESASSRKTAAYVSFGIGGAAFAAFAIHEAAWSSKCPNQKCDPAEVDIGARRAVSFVLFGIGVAGAGLGAYFLISGRSSESESAMIVRPVLGPHGASLSVARKF